MSNKIENYKGGMMRNMILQEKLAESFCAFKNNIAIDAGRNQLLTYSQLDRTSNYIANRLLETGVDKETFIGVFTDDRVQLITAVIGILKAGGVFILLDSDYPRDRLVTMIESTNMKRLFIDRKNFQRFSIGESSPAQTLQTLEIDFCDDWFNDGKPSWSTEKPNLHPDPEDKVYIYFTSGTTGKPRAILGKNKGLSHFIDWEIEEFGIDETYRFSQFTTPVFDVFLRDIFVPLCSGGTICIPPDKGMMTTGTPLTRLIDRKRINLIHCVPSLFRLINSTSLEKENFPYLKYILLAGEKVTPGDLKKWYAVFGSRVQLVNLYGPTETTLAKVFYRIQPADVDREIIPIGKPIRGTRVIVMDQQMKPCDKLNVGELYIRTPYRTYGYYDDPGLNREKFIPNPLGSSPDDLLYKTGDLGRVLNDGNIELTGRVDRQIKIRGFRVEPEGIENLSMQYPAVKEAVVIKKEAANQTDLLCAYIITEEKNSNPDQQLTDRLKEYLSARLPDYSVPAQVIKIGEIPRKPNGKIDYDALAAETAADTREYILPRTPLEERLFKLWTEVLQFDKFGVTDNFFALGGNSLNVMDLITKIHTEFDKIIALAEPNKRIALGEIYFNNTIEMQAALIEKMEEPPEGVTVTARKEVESVINQ
jgi:amino acid adenylation domain-containing protein